MLKSYILISLRNLFKNKSFAVINIIGLSIGIAAFLLIALFIHDEIEYDKFHQKADRVFRLSPPNYARTAPLLSPTLKSEFPEIESSIRLKRFGGVVKQGDIHFTEDNVGFANQDILNIFSFEFMQGNASQALSDPNSVIIDDQLALKYFNSTQVLGKQLFIQDTLPLTITGVYKSWPANSHLQLNMIASFSTFANMGVNLETWSNNLYYTYVLLDEKSNPERFKSKIPGFLDKHIRSLPNRENYELEAQNLSDIHLKSNKDMEWAVNGSISTIYIFVVLALMILMIACINFVNLSTAVATRRAKEIGVRKTIGANNYQLINQFLAESTLLSTIALILAIAFVYIGLPYLNQISNKEISFLIFQKPSTITLLFCFTLLVGILAGSYPALVLSSFRPLDIFSKKITVGLKGMLLRKGLVVFQFSLSLLLIIGSITVYKQLDFMQNKDLGFDKNQVLILPYSWDQQIQQKYNVLKTEFEQHNGIDKVTRSGDIPGRMATTMSYWAEGMSTDESKGIQALYIDKDFSEVYGLEFLSGRDINNESQTDLENAYLLNEKAVASLGWSPEEAIGKRFSVHSDGKVIGVVKNFHYNSLHQNVQPLFLAIRPDWAGYLSLRVNTTEVDQVIHFLEETWRSHIPDFPFTYTFLDEDYNRLYLAEARMGKIVTLFTLLAIFIACLGLFGLMTFSLEKRNKEIAVRKVLGSSIYEVVLLLSKDFLFPVLLSIIIASPIAYFLGKSWLSNFAYQIEPNLLWFLTAAILLIVLAWLSLGIQAIQAAKINPIKWLNDQ